MNTSVTSLVSSSILPTLYPVMTSFCPSIGGMPHDKRMERDERTVALKFVGGEEGAVGVQIECGDVNCP